MTLGGCDESKCFDDVWTLNIRALKKDTPLRGDAVWSKDGRTPMPKALDWLDRCDIETLRVGYRAEVETNMTLRAEVRS